MDSKPCNTCGETKSNSEFARDAKGNGRPSGGRKRTCKACVSVADRALLSNLESRYPSAMKIARSGKSPWKNYDHRPKRRVLEGPFIEELQCVTSYANARGARHGLKDGAVLDILKRQGGSCGVCSRPFGRDLDWVLDHSHDCCPEPASQCGKCVRGIICKSCNARLGKAGDTLEAVSEMFDYLLEYHDRVTELGITPQALDIEDDGQVHSLQ